jgi:hypothetical protein
MFDKFKNAKRAGMFTIPPDKTVYGELTYAGPRTSLYLRDTAYFDTHPIEGGCLKGTLHDLTRVTLLHCLTTPAPGYAGSGTERYYFAEVFPHFVVHGDRHISNGEKVITEVQFLVDDASTLFYDFDAFGTLIDARPLIEEVVRAKRREREKWPTPNRDIRVGPEPAILYFTGQHEILSIDTVLGKVHARHHTSRSLGGPSGVYVKNRIFTGITFEDACSFDDSINRTLTLLRFLEVVVGRPQNVLSLQVHIKSEGEIPCILDVYWSMPPKRELSGDVPPEPADVLINGGTNPDEFARVLSNWLNRDETWRDARLRFSNCFAEQHHYSIDRLVGAANMFDILPRSAVPPDIPLSEELKSAKEKCSTICRQLPASPERDSLLNALGRVGKSTLKNKIRHRGKLLIDAVGERFPDLTTVTDEAVNCRNYYVHGAEPRFEYANHLEVPHFFTDTLEFLFAASDLIEAGWDVKAWCATPTSMSHPFGRYRIGYLENLRKLISLLPKS